MKRFGLFRSFKKILKKILCTFSYVYTLNAKIFGAKSFGENNFGEQMFGGFCIKSPKISVKMDF